MDKEHINIRRIFKDSYRVRIAAGMIRSIDDTRERGDLGTGCAKMDKAMARQLTTVLMTIADMVKYFREGVAVHLSSVEDTRNIYEAILDHTDYWHQIMMTGVNAGQAPAQDLIDMEMFAAAVYEFAKYDYANKPKVSINGPLGALFNMSSTDLIDLNAPAAFSPQVRSTKEHHYKPNTDVFKQAVLRNQEKYRG